MIMDNITGTVASLVVGYYATKVRDDVFRKINCISFIFLSYLLAAHVQNVRAVGPLHSAVWKRAQYLKATPPDSSLSAFLDLDRHTQFMTEKFLGNFHAT